MQDPELSSEPEPFVTKFNFVMISAGFEHGGNVMHRHLDGHSQLLVYPFESQLGNRNFNDFLASIERVQYRYPEFPEGLSPRELYEQIVDEELKTFLRKRNGSKFKNADLQLSETDRIAAFEDYLGGGVINRRRVIEAFFRSTFDAWRNYYGTPAHDKTYVGYSPSIGIDADRIIRDFPNARIIHMVRNPFSAYRDTKRRPFPQPLTKYLTIWNIYHSVVEMFSKIYPHNVRIVRYEDFVADKEAAMRNLSTFIGVNFEPSMLYPSWNGNELKNDIAPWGTVLRASEDYNASLIDELSADEKKVIVAATMALARHFDYGSIDYLRNFYGA